MNRKMVFFMSGQIIGVEALFLLVSAGVGFCYRETGAAVSLLITAGIAALIFLISQLFRPKDEIIFAKDGFVTVAAAWILLSAVGALPFYISGEIPHYIDAFFETVSGFTTTGASILTDVEKMSRGLLFWRSFTHWVGGMGVLVFIMAIIPAASGRTIHLMRAEMPGPIVGKLVPRIRGTAKILYLMYVCFTAAEIIFLLFGKMSLFDSVVHSFGTAGTGGFGIKADSIGSYSPYIQWVIAIFMMLFGINFNLYYLVIAGKFKSAIKSAEMWTYFAIIAVSTVLVTFNILSLFPNFGTALRHGFFQVISIITTTGYGTADFNLWPEFSKSILFLIMFIGGCAGSTAGGIKIARVCLGFKMIRNNFRHMLHPRSVESVKFEGKKVDDETLAGVGVYYVLYFICIAAVFLLLSINGFSFETNVSATVSCFNNIGPGLGDVGPASSYAAYSPFSKFVLSCAMLLGRLEIYPLLIFFTASNWTKK